ncbi:MAG: hypothetical protein KDK04_04675 [Candidatus Competibacteraceae bacterium]|nr:hypothetical protein [Candidatus Competibacteraceae bacterium]MCB1811004.1 hypothetical protein [Candidatus Competibacteraceae bacterium]
MQEPVLVSVGSAFMVDSDGIAADAAESSGCAHRFSKFTPAGLIIIQNALDTFWEERSTGTNRSIGCGQRMILLDYYSHVCNGGRRESVFVRNGNILSGSIGMLDADFTSFSTLLQPRVVRWLQRLAFDRQGHLVTNFYTDPLLMNRIGNPTCCGDKHLRQKTVNVFMT